MSGTRHALFIFGVVLSLGGGGCAAWGVLDDGTSLSVGRSNGGELRHPARLPVHGDGWTVPARWATRGNHYGTDELVDLLIGTSRRVQVRDPGPALAIADLSPLSGGASTWHRSHQSGRDADLLFFVTDDAGQRVDAVEMRRFGADGLTIDDLDDGQVRPRRRFDVARNWDLVRALLEATEADIQFLFIFQPLADRLIAHARALGEPEELVVRAQAMLRQPGDSAPHDDHLHVRIWCAAADLEFGCIDRGLRGEEGDDLRLAALPDDMRRALEAPLPAMAVLWGRLTW